MDKLFLFQQKVGAIKKDSVNPYYKSKYADINGLLDVIKPVLNEVGLTAVQPLDIKDGKNILVTKILDEGKVILESQIILPDNLDPQKVGSAITYYRRYSLQALLLLEAEDDDAEGAKQRKPEQKPEPKTTAKKTELNSTLDQSVLDKINKAKTETELKNIWFELSDDDRPKYTEIISTRKSILKANKG